MDKNKSKKNNSYDQSLINALAQKYRVSKIYVRQCLRGERNSLTAEGIKTDYKHLVNKIRLIIKSQQQ